MVIDPIMATKLIAPGITRTALAQLRRKMSSKRAAAEDDARQSRDEMVLQESLTLLRNVLTLGCHSTVEDLHAITGIVAPPPLWVHAEGVDIPAVFVARAAGLVQQQLGPDLLDRVGRTWWQWRRAGSAVRAQWVEMRADYDDRKARSDPGTKVIFYLHGGAYYLGGIGHEVQIQRHARKLKGRCFAPRYRLAPQFPFPCAIQDILSAYLYLLTVVDPSHVVIAGDSAGGGLCLALLLIIRDQGLPMPAGASLISPWVDLVHSFPSITAPTEYDYIPNTGFHAKHSLAWPPPPTDEMEALGIRRNPNLPPDYEVEMNGRPFTMTEQINMYAQNHELTYPLVSPVHAASLGGFCPCQVLIGGGEVLRDEQLYLAHKMARPAGYPLSARVAAYNRERPEDQLKHPPTDVQLLVFDDGPHAAPTLGHVDVAKFQYRAVSQFAAWALARAQNAEVEIEDFADDDSGDWAAETLSLVGGSSLSPPGKPGDVSPPGEPGDVSVLGTPGRSRSEYGPLRAGYPLPPFEEHMQRFRVTRQGVLLPLDPPASIPCLNIPASEIGWPKGEALAGWIQYKTSVDQKFASEKKKIYEKRLANAKKGYVPLPDGEIAPPTALVGRRVVGEAVEMDAPTTAGLSNSILARLFRSMDAPDASSSKKTTWAGGHAGSGSGGKSWKRDEMMGDQVAITARRSSRVVRPESWYL